MVFRENAIIPCRVFFNLFRLPEGSILFHPVPPPNMHPPFLLVATHRVTFQHPLAFRQPVVCPPEESQTLEQGLLQPTHISQVNQIHRHGPSRTSSMFPTSVWP